MKIVRGNGRDWNDDEVRDALQALYAPPSNESYWDTLERSVLARVRAEGARQWWSYFPGWVRIGIAAAAAVLALSSVASWHSRTAQTRMVYDELNGLPADLPVLSETLGNEPNADAREATLRYLITHD
jgi:hypothetical protein